MSFFSRRNKAKMYNNDTTELWEYKIVKITDVTSSTSHTIDYSSYNFTTVAAVIPVVVRNIASASQACFPIVKSFNNTQAVIAVAESKNTGVLIGGNIEGLELVSSITINLIIIGT